MTTTVIIENEAAGDNTIHDLLKEAQPNVNIKAKLNNVKDSIQYFKQNGICDLIICDVQLSDGLSFSIFDEVNIQVPVIFITKHDQEILNILNNGSFSYLLKPVNKDDLVQALNKCMNEKAPLMQHHVTSPIVAPLNGKKSRTRLIVKSGIEHISLPVEEIVLFFTQNKITYAVDKCGNQYLTDKNLTDLEMELDGKFFFRANRQFILNINYIHSFKPYQKVKLQVTLTQPELNFQIIISQENAAGFKLWMSEDY